MRVHLVALPHTDLAADWSTCAYTGKLRRLPGMLAAGGHEAITYGGPRSEAPCEHVPIVADADRRRWFGDETWRDRVFDCWDAGDVCWREMNAAAIAAIRERIGPRDLVGLIAGTCQAAVADAFPAHIAWEWGVGYAGVLARSYRVFESHAWRAHVAGLRSDDDFRAFDDVIPNSWEPDEFPRLGTGSGAYALFVGRLIRRKGPHVAAAAAAAAGMRLVVAGQGVARVEPGRIVTADGTELAGDVEYAGVVGPDERARLMEDAAVLLAPTQYCEPFGGVAVESQLAGTPVVATPWGGFLETVAPGVSGHHAATLAEFTAALRATPALNRAAIRRRAVATWTTPAVAPRYAANLARLDTLWRGGWYEPG